LKDIGDTVFQERKKAMKTLCAGLMVVGLMALTGCNQSTTGGGGQAGGTFKLKGPVTSTTIKHGGQEVVDITVDNDKNFKEDVALTADVNPADKGVTAELDPKTVKAGDPKTAKLTIKASDKAAAGDYQVVVTGKPAKGDSTNVAVKVKVPEKK
jgi:uncharacterized membrane protein